jgi:hypothetical protein
MPVYANREANALQDERRIALSAMYETTALMVIMVVGHGCAAAMITYSPLLAAFQAMYATACNVSPNFSTMHACRRQLIGGLTISLLSHHVGRVTLECCDGLPWLVFESPCSAAVTTACILKAR